MVVERFGGCVFGCLRVDRSPFPMTAIRFPYRRPRQGGETSVVGSRSPAASPAPCVGYCTERLLNVRHGRRGTNSTKFAVAQHLRRSARSGCPVAALGWPRVSQHVRIARGIAVGGARDGQRKRARHSPSANVGGARPWRRFRPTCAPSVLPEPIEAVGPPRELPSGC